MGFGLAPAGNNGHWGPVTSTLDWCEENYIVTSYLAEFWNSTSNILCFILGFIGIYSSLKVGVCDRRCYIGNYCFMLVGLGSFLFHSTLWFETQMMDELPMIYGTCVLVFSQLRVFPSTNTHNTLLASALFIYSLLVTAMYLHLNNPIFHELCYALLIAIIILLPPFQFRHFKPSKRHTMWNLYWFGIVSFLGGFVLWNIDNTCCEFLRAFRQTVGYPLRVFFEFHVWWHIGTSLGTYSMGLLATFMRQVALGREDVEVCWVGGVFPVLSRGMVYQYESLVKPTRRLHKDEKKVATHA
ncbi:Alkaline ceramidase 3 [Podochytrium sp. JEL0797]|nr:Alkaline ceramidase 3 [Podochytrium sp. JEL0797]